MNKIDILENIKSFICQGDDGGRQIEQIETLVKTLYLFTTSSQLEIFIVTNDFSFYQDILRSFTSWGVDVNNKIR